MREIGAVREDYGVVAGERWWEGGKGDKLDFVRCGISLLRLFSFGLVSRRAWF
jgi:hypothetical protein